MIVGSSFHLHSTITIAYDKGFKSKVTHCLRHNHLGLHPLSLVIM